MVVEARTPERLRPLEQRESEQWPKAELEQPVEVAPAAEAALVEPEEEEVPGKPAAVQPAPEPAFAPLTAGNSGSRYMLGELLSRILDKST